MSLDWSRRNNDPELAAVLNELVGLIRDLRAWVRAKARTAGGSRDLGEPPATS